MENPNIASEYVKALARIAALEKENARLRNVLDSVLLDCDRLHESELHPQITQRIKAALAGGEGGDA